MYLFWQKLKFLLIPAALAIFLFGGLFCFRYLNRPKPAPIVPRAELTLTIIPGWNSRQVADYLVAKKLATGTEAVYAIIGEPAERYKKGTSFGPDDSLLKEKPSGLGMEGYLAPETVRVFADSSLSEVIEKFYFTRKKEITAEMMVAAKNKGKTIHQILTMASIVEKEVLHDKDRAIVSDILWRRLQKNWALQVDSSVHFVADRSGDIFTTAQERQIDSPWNTYKYPGLPPGPICNPSLESITAALYPEKNDYWYFLSDHDGNMYYGRTLEEHNQNKYKYLR